MDTETLVEVLKDGWLFYSIGKEIYRYLNRKRPKPKKRKGKRRKGKRR